MRIALTVLLLTAAATPAAAQQSRFAVGGEAGYARTWDDESFRGSGLVTGARASWFLTDKASLELGVSRIPHYRKFEFQNFDTEGVSWLTSLSARYDLNSGPVRPFVLAGMSVNRHTGRWDDAPERTNTSKGYHGALGIAVNHGRLQHAIEGRLHMFDIDDDSAAAAIISGTYSLRIRL